MSLCVWLPTRSLLRASSATVGVADGTRRVGRDRSAHRRWRYVRRLPDRCLAWLGTDRRVLRALLPRLHRSGDRGSSSWVVHRNGPAATHLVHRCAAGIPVLHRRTPQVTQGHPPQRCATSGRQISDHAGDNVARADHRPRSDVPRQPATQHTPASNPQRIGSRGRASSTTTRHSSTPARETRSGCRTNPAAPPRRPQYPARASGRTRDSPTTQCLSRRAGSSEALRRSADARPRPARSPAVRGAWHISIPVPEATGRSAGDAFDATRGTAGPRLFSSGLCGAGPRSSRLRSSGLPSARLRSSGLCGSAATKAGVRGAQACRCPGPPEPESAL